jgi:hypothetical protein
MPVRFSFSPGKPGKSRKSSAPAASVETNPVTWAPEALLRIEAAFLSPVAYRRPVLIRAMRSSGCRLTTVSIEVYREL